MKKGLMLSALLLCSCGPGSPKATVTPSPNIEAEEYADGMAIVIVSKDERVHFSVHAEP